MIGGANTVTWLPPTLGFCVYYEITPLRYFNTISGDEVDTFARQGGILRRELRFPSQFANSKTLSVLSQRRLLGLECSYSRTKQGKRRKVSSGKGKNAFPPSRYIALIWKIRDLYLNPVIHPASITHWMFLAISHVPWRLGLTCPYPILQTQTWVWRRALKPLSEATAWLCNSRLWRLDWIALSSRMQQTGDVGYHVKAMVIRFIYPFHVGEDGRMLQRTTHSICCTLILSLPVSDLEHQNHCSAIEINSLVLHDTAYPHCLGGAWVKS